MAMIDRPIGKYLRRFRTEHHLQQNKVAESIGITPQQYLKYEKDVNTPSVNLIINLADTYNVSADYLLGRSDMPQPTNFDEREVKAAFAFRDAWKVEVVAGISSFGLFFGIGELDGFGNYVDGGFFVADLVPSDEIEKVNAVVLTSTVDSNAGSRSRRAFLRVMLINVAGKSAGK